MAAVVNAMVKRRDVDRVMWGSGRRAQANLWVKHRNRTMVASKPGHTLCLGTAGRVPTYWPGGVRCRAGVSLIRAFVRNLRTWLVVLRGKIQAEEPRGRKYRWTNQG